MSYSTITAHSSLRSTTLHGGAAAKCPVTGVLDTVIMQSFSPQVFIKHLQLATPTVNGPEQQDNLPLLPGSGRQTANEEKVSFGEHGEHIWLGHVVPQDIPQWRLKRRDSAGGD